MKSVLLSQIYLLHVKRCPISHQVCQNLPSSGQNTRRQEEDSDHQEHPQSCVWADTQGEAKNHYINYHLRQHAAEGEKLTQFKTFVTMHVLRKHALKKILVFYFNYYSVPNGTQTVTLHNASLSRFHLPWLINTIINSRFEILLFLLYLWAYGIWQ